MRKILTLLQSRRGETLMEGIVSMMVFTILMAAVTLIIMASLRVTGHATQEANDTQNAANEALRKSSADAAECDGTSHTPVTITFEDTVSGEELEFTVNVAEANVGGFTAFAPCDCTP
ncbi:MAG: hypothetical protein FWG72_02360 [Oscillospiraceae bacterium]|nr:hypothetical protein [Oscillospiraceae bacterium]